MEASMTFVQPGAPSTPSRAPEKKPNPAELMKQKQLEKLKNQEKQIQDKLKRLGPVPKQKQPLTNVLKAFIGRIIQAQDPNDDPIALYAQVRPLLVKMRLHNITVPNKTELMIGKTQAKNSNYCILLRRQGEIDSTIIDNIKRNEKNLDKIVWHSAGIKVYVWWPYNAPAEEGAPTAPGVI
jgi:hypothetical protein